MFLPFENPAKNIIHFFFVGFVKGKTRKRILSFQNPAKNILHLFFVEKYNLENIFWVCQRENKKKIPFVSKTRQKIFFIFSSFGLSKRKIFIFSLLGLSKGKQEKRFLSFRNAAKPKRKIFIFSLLGNII